MVVDREEQEGRLCALRSPTVHKCFFFLGCSKSKMGLQIIQLKFIPRQYWLCDGAGTLPNLCNERWIKRQSAPGIKHIAAGAARSHRSWCLTATAVIHAAVQTDPRCPRRSSSSPLCSRGDDQHTNNSCKCDISIGFMQYSLFWLSRYQLEEAEWLFEEARERADHEVISSD